MKARDMDVFDRIGNEYYQLTDAERKVADYVVVHQGDTQLMSISELSEACGVAEATISRFCRRLNYKGYGAFKLAVANSDARVSRDFPVTGEISEDGSVLEAARKRCAENHDALTQTLAFLRPESIEKAAKRILRSERVICMGQGGSMLMALEAAHLFSTVLSNFQALPDSHLQAIAAANLTERDTVLFFSYSGSTRDSLELLPLARERGARVILVTRFPKSPAAAFADIILQCGSNELPHQHGSVPARIAQLFVLDVLITEVYRRDKERCDAFRKRAASALTARHV